MRTKPTTMTVAVALCQWGSFVSVKAQTPDEVIELRKQVTVLRQTAAAP